MVKIEAVIQPSRLDAIKVALDGLGIHGVTICHVLDHSGPLGLKAFYRGGEYYVDVPRVKLEMLVSSHLADDVIETLLREARTGADVDDGTIMVYEIAEAIRIRNGARAHFSLS